MILDGVCYMQVVVVLVPGIIQLEEVNGQPVAVHPCHNRRLWLGSTTILS
jgi:hypothetical protein